MKVKGFLPSYFAIIDVINPVLQELIRLQHCLSSFASASSLQTLLFRQVQHPFDITHL